MPEDQLTRRERVRLESLAMALRMPYRGEGAEDEIAAAIFRRAEEVERWLLAADHVGN